MTEPYRILLMTSDKYLDILKPSCHLINKYWQPNPEVIVAGFTPPAFDLPPNFHFLSIGKFEDYPFKKWSDALIRVLNIIDDEVIVLMLDDYFTLRPVDTRNVKILYGYARQFGYVLKIDLCVDRLYAGGTDMNYGVVDHIDLIKSMPGSPYHMSLWPGLWRRDNLLRLLIPDESPHDIELQGTTRLSHMGNSLIVLGTRQFPLRMYSSLRGANPNHIDLSELNENDVREMDALGYLDSWKPQDTK
jgi:hypothetical protein